MAKNITFRTQLLGSVHEFCMASRLKLFSNALHLVELIVLLARYQEEGVSLVPKVYVTSNMSLLSSMLPSGERMKIGEATADTEGIKLALKKCAPLANGGWMIYLEDKVDAIEFGVFKGTSNPIAVLIDDVLMNKNDDLHVVKAFQIANDCVEIQSNQGNIHYIFLNHRKEDAPAPLQYLEELVLAIAKGCGEELKEPTQAFLKRLLFESLRQSHGCLIAVTDQAVAPVFLASDGVILDNAIDFPDLIRLFKKGEIDSAMIDSKGSLLQGMLNSDGIILFDNSGRLLGYNCFVKVKSEDGVIGGARRRAFAGLCGEIGKGLSAVFMQSQDGWSEFRGEKQ